MLEHENTKEPLLLKFNLKPFTETSVAKYKINSLKYWNAIVQFLERALITQFLLLVVLTLVVLTLVVLVATALNQHVQDLAIAAICLVGSLTFTVLLIEQGIMKWMPQWKIHFIGEISIFEDDVANFKKETNPVSNYPSFYVDALYQGNKLKEAFLVMKSDYLSVEHLYIKHTKFEPPIPCTKARSIQSKE